MRDGPEIPGAVVLLDAREAHARELLAKVNAHEEEALVVREIRVVPRAPLLDELALEQERLGLGFHLDGVEIGDHLDQGADFRLGDCPRPPALKIRGDPLFQTLCLTDVNDSPQAVLHEVNARFVGEVPHLLLEINRF